MKSVKRRKEINQLANKQGLGKRDGSNRKKQMLWTDTTTTGNGSSSSLVVVAQLRRKYVNGEKRKSRRDSRKCRKISYVCSALQAMPLS